MPGQAEEQVDTLGAKHVIRIYDIPKTVPYAFPCNRDVSDSPSSTLTLYQMVT